MLRTLLLLAGLRPALGSAGRRSAFPMVVVLAGGLTACVFAACGAQDYARAPDEISMDAGSTERASSSGGARVRGTGGSTGSGGRPVPAGSGGAPVADAGAGTGGVGTGGARTGGAGTGGASTGGSTSTGTGGAGPGSGGASSGGASTGGASSGGASTGGAGTGGASVSPRAQYDFESFSQGRDGWTNGVGTPPFSSIARSSAQHFAGQWSLAGAVDATAAGTYILEVRPPVPDVPAGATVTFHVYVPSGAAMDAIQPYVLDANFVFTGAFDGSFTPGGWTTLAVTVPSPSPQIIRLGVQFVVSGPWTGVVFVDSVGW